MRSSSSGDPPRHSAPTGTIATLHRLALLDAEARDARTSGVMAVGLIGFLGLLLRDAAPEAPYGWWLAAVALAASLRATIRWAWRRARTRDPRFPKDAADLRHWESASVTSALVAGCCWASLVFVVEDPEQAALPVTMILTLALLLASTSAFNSQLSIAFFAIPIVFAQEANLIRLALEGPDRHHSSMAAVWLLLVVLLFFVKRNASALLRERFVDSIDHERRASEQTALLESAPLGVLVARGARIVVCNGALLKMLGYARKEDLLGQSIRTLIPDDATWRETLRSAEAALAGPVASHIVKRRRADGSVVPVMFTIAAVATVGGEHEFIGIYEDVEHRLAAEGNYRHAVRMQRLVFESAGEGIAIVNGGVIEQANQALADLLGTSTAQLTNRPLETLFEDPAEWSGIEGHFQRLGTTLKVERRIVRSDGRAVWVNVTGRAADAVDGAVDEHGASAHPAHRSIWVFADLSVQKQKEVENWHHANHDVMTGLPNRRFLQDRLDQALASARRDGRRVAVVELDLDGFKSVNDAHGHRFGDAVIEEVARRLSAIVRDLDTVGRWGGDEFVLVLREIDSREVVEETVKRVIGRLSEPIVYLGQTLTVGASIGIALFPDHGDEVEVLMLAADLAMYESKAGGGNAWRFASQAQGAARGKYRPAVAATPTVED